MGIYAFREVVLDSIGLNSIHYQHRSKQSLSERRLKSKCIIFLIINNILFFFVNLVTCMGDTEIAMSMDMVCRSTFSKSNTNSLPTAHRTAASCTAMEECVC